MLLAYQGTLLFVSHDRQFASLLAEELWVVDQGALHLFAGTFESWLQSAKESAEESPAPRKLRPTRRSPQVKKPPSPALDEYLMGIIDGLENRIKEIQLQLEEASERRDLETIARIGREYDRTKAQLDEKLAEWGG